MRRFFKPTGTSRRGAVVVQVAIAMVMLLSFAALAIDTGRMYVVRVELQNAVDSAALGGVSGYVTTTGLSQNRSALQTLCGNRSVDGCHRNNTGRTPLNLAGADVILGRHSWAHPNDALDQSPGVRYNSVEATLRMTQGSLNGAMGLLFAPIFGQEIVNQTALARAVFDDRWSGLRSEIAGYPHLVPFTMDVNNFETQRNTTGQDQFSWNNAVVNSPDGVREVKLYPYSSVPGNFGILQFGGSGTPVVVDQILNGVSSHELEHAMGTSDPVYFDSHGSAVHYAMPGTPGLRTALESAFEQQVGNVIGFFVHDSVGGQGTNSIYQNCGMRFARVMEAHLTGPPLQKTITIQPVALTGRSYIMNENAPSSGGLVGRIVLTR